VVELTIDQALQQAVEAQKAGQTQEADRIYTAILKAQPKHPDANHNMGVLAVGVDKVQEALPFFKTALEANPNIAPFWLSFIDALIKLDKLADAEAVLAQAKSKGTKGDGFDKLEQQLYEADKVQEPPQAQIQELINLYSQGQLQQALKQAETLVQKFPKSPVLFNIQGAALKSVGQLGASVKAFNKALAIKPDYAEAYYNMGVTLKDQGKQAEAIEAYNKALAIKPDYADAYLNMGNALKDQGKSDVAIDAFNKGLAIKPD
jgi:tetratricopeptide (TPR) repeat protein